MGKARQAAAEVLQELTVPQLAETIRGLVLAGRYVVGAHAAERLEERGILEWQVIVAMDTARVLSEQPDARPYPTAVFEIILANGETATAVWSWIRALDLAKLVTVFFVDGKP